MITVHLFNLKTLVLYQYLLHFADTFSVETTDVLISCFFTATSVICAEPTRTLGEYPRFSNHIKMPVSHKMYFHGWL